MSWHGCSLFVVCMEWRKRWKCRRSKGRQFRQGPEAEKRFLDEERDRHRHTRASLRKRWSSARELTQIPSRILKTLPQSVRPLHLINPCRRHQSLTYLSQISTLRKMADLSTIATSPRMRVWMKATAGRITSLSGTIFKMIMALDHKTDDRPQKKQTPRRRSRFLRTSILWFACQSKRRTGRG